VGKTVGAGVAGGAVGVDRSMGVDKGGAILSKESEQALKLSMAILAAKRIRVRFISLSFLVGAFPPH